MIHLEPIKNPTIRVPKYVQAMQYMAKNAPVFHVPTVKKAAKEEMEKAPENFPIQLPEMGLFYQTTWPVVADAGADMRMELDIIFHAMPMANSAKDIPGKFRKELWPVHEGLRGVSRYMEAPRPGVVIGLWTKMTDDQYHGPMLLLAAPLTESLTLEHTRVPQGLTFHTARYNTTTDAALREYTDWLYRSGMTALLATLMASQKLTVVT